KPPREGNALDDPAHAHERAGMHDGRGGVRCVLGPHQLQVATGAADLNEAVAVNGADGCCRTEGAGSCCTWPRVQEDDVVATGRAAPTKAVHDGVHGGTSWSRPGQRDVAAGGP